MHLDVARKAVLEASEARHSAKVRRAHTDMHDTYWMISVIKHVALASPVFIFDVNSSTVSDSVARSRAAICAPQSR